MTKKIFVITCLTVLVLVAVYGWFKQVVVIFANEDIDNYGFGASVTCRRDEMFTYYPYLVIKSSHGMEVSRSQINGKGYEALKACRVSFPVERSNWLRTSALFERTSVEETHLADLSTLDIPVSYFSPR